MNQASKRGLFPYGGGPDGSDVDWVRLHQTRAQVQQALRRQAEGREAQRGQPALPADADRSRTWSAMNPPHMRRLGQGDQPDAFPSRPAPLAASPLFEPSPVSVRLGGLRTLDQSPGAAASPRLQPALLQSGHGEDQLFESELEAARPGAERWGEPAAWDEEEPELFLLASDSKGGGKKSAKAQRAEKRAAEEAARVKEEERKKKEHTTNARPSTKGKHQIGAGRRKRDEGGEKGDKRRPYMFVPPLRYFINPGTEEIIRRFGPIPTQRPGENDVDYHERTRPYWTA